MNPFAVPSRTSFDLNFRLFGVPVRVHPLFWLSTLLLSGGGGRDPWLVVLWVVCCFVSILWHEFGHVVAMMWAGDRGDIVLHSFGGLAIPYRGCGGPTQQAVISAAGPVAGFLLAAVLWTGIAVGGGSVLVKFSSFGLPTFYPDVSFVMTAGHSQRAYFLAFYAAYYLLYINIYWGLMNMLPVYPLDGGQMTRALWERHDPASGLRRSLQVSLVVAGLVAVSALTSNRMYQMLLFGYLAYGSYQALQTYRPVRRVEPEESVRLAAVLTASAAAAE
ncbi:MAG: site-2 protease family protein [Paludibaculum sp.]